LAAVSFSGFDHVDARVADLAAVEPFYDALCTGLGLTKKHYVTVRGDSWQFGVPPGLHNTVEYHEQVESGPDCFIGIIEDPEHRPGRTRIAFRVSSAEEVEAWVDRLPAIGALHVETSADMDEYPAVFFEDALGTKLEICCRRPT
jgi:catechol 2,3-dioxygenase-like lactoylglutathione lyase family enzyme